MGGGRRWFLGKRILCTDVEADLPAEALEKPSKESETISISKSLL